MTTKKRVPRPTTDTIGGRIRRRMEELLLNQSELARRTGIERTDVNRIVNDHRKPRPDQLTWIAKVLDLSEMELLGEQLPPDLEKARAELAKLAERILGVEAECANARQAAEEACVRLDNERRAFGQERATLLASAETERQKRLAVEKKLEDLRILHEREKHASARVIVALQLQAKELVLRNQALETAAVSLRHMIAKEQAAKFETGTLAGLAGLFAGVILTDSGSPKRRS